MLFTAASEVVLPPTHPYWFVVPVCIFKNNLIKLILPCIDIPISFVSGPVGLLTMMVAKSCGVSNVAITGKFPEKSFFFLSTYQKGVQWREFYFRYIRLSQKKKSVLNIFT